MKRGFTMIELIFVIVVLGILASVALPKFAGVQDDAKIASEKGTVGALRAGISIVKGKYLIMSTQTSFDGNITTEGDRWVACNDHGYPINLDIATIKTGTPSAPAATDVAAISELFLNILSSTPDGWVLPVSNGSTGLRYNGPASKNSGGVASGELNSSTCWEYNGSIGGAGNDGQIRLLTSGC